MTMGIIIVSVAGYVSESITRNVGGQHVVLYVG